MCPIQIFFPLFCLVFVFTILPSLCFHHSTILYSRCLWNKQCCVVYKKTLFTLHTNIHDCAQTPQCVHESYNHRTYWMCIQHRFHTLYIWGLSMPVTVCVCASWAFRVPFSHILAVWAIYQCYWGHRLSTLPLVQLCSVHASYSSSSELCSYYYHLQRQKIRTLILLNFKTSVLYKEF